MNSFRYDGVIPASKSHFNRALICASYDLTVKLQGDSSCDDVVKMKRAVQLLGPGGTYDCGSAGTVLRFLALRVSRIPGRHILKGTTRLFSRPYQDLADIFDQLQVNYQFHSDHVVIDSQGWKLKNDTLKVNREKSSQFASGIILNAWNLDFPLTIEWDDVGVSEGYWQMSAQVVKDFGMEIKQTEHQVLIPKNQKIKIKSYQVESDLSSAFAIAAFASLNGEATFRDFPFKSLQPDKVFVQILEEMGAGVEKGKDYVRVYQKNGKNILHGVHWNLNECPDLFPVLSTLCAFAHGPSRLDGAPHLAYKESNRILKTAEILNAIGVETKILPDGMEIHPPEKLNLQVKPFNYDTDHDHRLAFAAALLRSQNGPIEIVHPEVVDKSFPEFWDVIANKSTAILS